MAVNPWAQLSEGVESSSFLDWGFFLARDVLLGSALALGFALDFDLPFDLDVGLDFVSVLEAAGTSTASAGLSVFVSDGAFFFFFFWVFLPLLGGVGGGMIRSTTLPGN